MKHKRRRIAYRRIRNMCQKIWEENIRWKEHFELDNSEGISQFIWDTMEFQFKESLADLIQDDLRGRNKARRKKQ